MHAGPGLMFSLTLDSAADYLRRRGIVPDGVPVTARPLSGGVSNDVLAVTGPGVSLVIKQALPRLRVAQEWLATPKRILTEAAALRLAARIRPGDVPGVADVDEQALTMTISLVDPRLRNWKTDLMAGRLDERTAVRLGEALADWHSATAADEQARTGFDDAAFVQLRTDPFHRAIAARHPDRGQRIDALVTEMLTTKLCLVHGDFSPKNVLADGPSISVLDWEVAHFGDPVFDLAFLQTHLLLKAVHRPDAAGGYHGLSTAFMQAYRSGVHAGLGRPDAYLGGHIACLLLARVDGKSPAEYLTSPEKLRVRKVARDALAADHATDADLWQAVRG